MALVVCWDWVGDSVVLSADIWRNKSIQYRLWHSLTSVWRYGSEVYCCECFVMLSWSVCWVTVVCRYVGLLLCVVMLSYCCVSVCWVTIVCRYVDLLMWAVILSYFCVYTVMSYCCVYRHVELLITNISRIVGLFFVCLEYGPNLSSKASQRYSFYSFVTRQ
jgi:hypothetical protein